MLRRCYWARPWEKQGLDPAFLAPTMVLPNAPLAASLGFKRGMWPIKPMPPTLPCLETKERMKAQQEVATLLRALKYLSPNNVFIFHDDETGKSLNFLLPMQHRKSRNESLEQQAATSPPPPGFFLQKNQRHFGRFYGSLASFCQVLFSFLPPSHHSVTFLRRRSWAACHRK